MTQVEKIATIKAYLGNDTEATEYAITVYLDDAKEAILTRRYPFGVPEGAEVPPMYERLQCRLAAEMFLRRGAEGEESHNEDGVNRKYASADFEPLLRNVMQIAKVG